MVSAGASASACLVLPAPSHLARTPGSARKHARNLRNAAPLVSDKKEIPRLRLAWKTGEQQARRQSLGRNEKEMTTKCGAGRAGSDFDTKTINTATATAAAAILRGRER